MSEHNTSHDHTRIFLDLCYRVAGEQIQQRRQTDRETSILYRAANMLGSLLHQPSLQSDSTDADRYERPFHSEDRDEVCRVISAVNQAVVFGYLLNADEWMTEDEIIWSACFDIGPHLVEIATLLDSLREQGVIKKEIRTNEETGEMTAWYRVNELQAPRAWATTSPQVE